ncbi:MAG: DcrB-related protein [Myxococcaceae bacterium]
MPKLQHGTLALTVPVGWVDVTEVALVAEPDEGFRPNLSVVRETLVPNEDARGYAARQLPKLAESLPEYKLIRERDAVYGWLSGVEREHSFVIEGQRFAQLHFYVAHQGIAYTFSLTHAEARAAALPQLATQLLSTVEWR